MRQFLNALIFVGLIFMVGLCTWSNIAVDQMKEETQYFKITGKDFANFDHETFSSGGMKHVIYFDRYDKDMKPIDCCIQEYIQVMEPFYGRIEIGKKYSKQQIRKFSRQ